MCCDEWLLWIIDSRVQDISENCNNMWHFPPWCYWKKLHNSHSVKTDTKWLNVLNLSEASSFSEFISPELKFLCDHCQYQKTTMASFRKTVLIENAAKNGPGYLDTLLHMEVLLFLAVLLGQSWNASIDVSAKIIQCLRKQLKFLFTLYHLSTQKTWVLHGCQTWLFYHLAYKHWKSRGGITHRFHKKQNPCLCNFKWLKDKHRCCICRHYIYNIILSIMLCFRQGKTLYVYIS